MKCAIDIPNYRPATLNELLRSVRSRIRLKKQDRKIIGGYAMLANIPKATGKRRVKLTITLAPRDRGPDPDSFWKSTLDALVSCGALVDDSPRYVELLPVEYVRGAPRATQIELEDVT